MQRLFATTGLLLSLSLASAAQAREVTITTELNAYRGDGAYLAIYLTDASGKYARTLWMAGGKSKYYKHLLDWTRGSGGKPDHHCRHRRHVDRRRLPRACGQRCRRSAGKPGRCRGATDHSGRRHSGGRTRLRQSAELFPVTARP